MRITERHLRQIIREELAGELTNVSKKEQSKNKTQEMKEGLHDTSWENEEGDKITLVDLLNATEDIPVEKISVEKLKPYLLTWDGDENKVNKIDSSDLQYPILIFVDSDGEFISIIDGHHRAHNAARKGLETIRAKVIPINSLPKDIRKVFSHMGRQDTLLVAWRGSHADIKQGGVTHHENHSGAAKKPNQRNAHQ